MPSNSITPNQREIIAAQGLTGRSEYLTSTNGALNVNGSFSITGGATSANQTNGSQKTQIVDGSGNVIGSTSNAIDVNIKSGSSAGQQYADGAARGTATGTLAMIDDGTLIQSAKGDTDGTIQTNNTKLGGTAIDTNSGVKSAGTQRIVLATDQPNLTTPLNVNVSQMAGVTPSSNTGATDAGTQRIVLSNDYLSTATIQAGPDSTTTGTIVANGGTVTAAVVAGMQGFGFAYYGTYSTGATLTWEASADGGTTYTAFTLQAAISLTGPVTVIAAVSNSQSFYEGVLPTGSTHVRIRCSAWAAPTGTINIRLVQSSQPRVQTTNTIASISAAIVSSIVPGVAATNLGKAEDAIAASGDTGVFALGIQTASPADTAADGDYVGLQVKNGRLWSSATIDTALPAGTNGIGKLTANSGVIIGDVNVVSNIPGTTATSLGKAEDAAHTTGDTGVLSLSVANEAQNVLVSGDGDYIARATDTKGNSLIVGNVASGTTDAGFPLKTGGVGKTANPTAVTDGQRVNATFDKLGKQVVVGSIRDLKGVQQTTITSSTAETTVVTAVASTFLDVYGVILTNTSATVTKVTFKDDTAGTTRFVLEVPPTDTRGFMLNESAGVPQAVVNKPWTATCGTSVASVEITMLYVKNT